MDQRDPDIIGRQTSLISILSVIVLVLLVMVFFFGYCEPRHERLNATPPSAPATSQAGGQSQGDNGASAQGTNASGNASASDSTRVGTGSNAAAADTSKGKDQSKQH